MVVAVAAKCLAGIANGLKKRFQPYVGQVDLIFIHVVIGVFFSYSSW